MQANHSTEYRALIAEQRAKFANVSDEELRELALKLQAKGPIKQFYGIWTYYGPEHREVIREMNRRNPRHANGAVWGGGLMDIEKLFSESERW